MRTGRQQTAQSSTYSCNCPPPGSTKVSSGSPHHGQDCMVRAIVRSILMARQARTTEAAAAPALPDEELVQRICRGDGSAVGALYDRYAPLLFATSLRILGSRPEAEDLL